ncbi:pectate lyase superfamily protein [Escherichia phage Minorna]|uniref:Pectate lyase superfamily protein n=1 Tax=Escherichia phage Minorna TaxID=2547246 RepID=A0A482IFD6_9CAUD|nr:tail spike protein [Escherichia phage Minorna]QBP07052.1 pectate lyase superfamily protein [Escherichia phage Minorna]
MLNLTKVATWLVNWKASATGAVERTMESKLMDNISVADFGAIPGNTDSRAAFQAAINHAHSLGGGAVTVPSGTWTLKGSLTFYNNVHLVGAGQGSTVLLYSAINVPFAAIGTASTNINNVHIRDLQIIVDGTHTSGDFITWTNGYNLCLENVRVDGPFYNFLKMHGGPQQFIYRVNNCTINGATTSEDVIVIGDTSSAVVQDVFLQNLVLSGGGKGCGVKEVNASGVYASNIDCLGMKYGYAWLPSGATKCRGSFYTAILGDTCKECGLMFAPTGGASVSDLNFNGCWGSSCGTTALHPGVHLNAENGGLENLNFNGLTCVNNKGSGILLTGYNVGGINFSNISCNANSMATRGQKHGIELGAGVQNVNFTNVKAGATPVFEFNNQGYGIFISDGIGSGVKFVNVDARGNVNGAISNASDAAVTIENCPQYVTYNTGAAKIASGTNSVTVPTGISRALQGRYVQVTPTTDINAPFWFEVSGQNIIIRVRNNVSGDQYFSWTVSAQR